MSEAFFQSKYFSNLMSIDHNIFHYHELDSTTYVAAELKSLNVPQFVVADTQYAGRGRRGNTWLDSNNAQLLASILLPINFYIQSLNNIYIIALVSLCQVLVENNCVAQLKWPNDILVDGKKAAGILVEIYSGSTEKLVLSLGVNCYSSSCGIHVGLKKEVVLAEFYHKFVLNNFLKASDLNKLFIKNDCFFNKKVEYFDKKTGKFLGCGLYQGLDLASMQPIIKNNYGVKLISLDMSIRIL